jgi:hypothetical protein
MIRFEQLSLDLFPARSFAEIIEQENFGHISVQVSNRLKRGWYVRLRRNEAHRQLVVPSYLAGAPEEIKRAVIRWAMMTRKRKAAIDPAIARERKGLERQALAYIDALSPEKRRSSHTIDPNKLEAQVKGCRYDLRELFDYLNERYFEGGLRSFVRWGKTGSTMSYQTYRHDKEGNRHSLITIAGVYNRGNVPDYAVIGVLYHEMLHLVYPPIVNNGRRVVHGADFKAAERAFKYFKEWRAWERSYLKTPAGRRRRKRRFLFF